MAFVGIGALLTLSTDTVVGLIGVGLIFLGAHMFSVLARKEYREELGILIKERRSWRVILGISSFLLAGCLFFVAYVLATS
jgi:hypothetical protein